MMIVFMLIGLASIVGCAKNPNRAGCTYIDGDARYGTLTQYAKGDAKGAHAYIGDNVKDLNIEITCDANNQTVKIKDKK